MCKCGCGCALSKLHACAFGLAFGITKGLFLLLFAWSAMYWGFGSALVAEISNVYYGFSATFIGGLYGAAYGFVVGFVFGFIVGKIYNLCICCCRCKMKKEGAGEKCCDCKCCNKTL